MRKFRRKYKILVLCLLGLFVSTPAQAYLDPGTGMAVLQGVIAAIAAVVVVLRLYWYRLLRFLGLRKNRGDQATGENNVSDAKEIDDHL